MLQLSLSWLRLGPLAASPWLLLLLLVASWLLARFLARAYAFYDNCCRLRCFSQPPKRNWFWGHLGLVSVGSRKSVVSGDWAPQVVGNGAQGFTWGLTSPENQDAPFPYSPSKFVPLLCAVRAPRPFLFLHFLAPSLLWVVFLPALPHRCTFEGFTGWAAQNQIPWWSVSAILRPVFVPLWTSAFPKGFTHLHGPFPQRGTAEMEERCSQSLFLLSFLGHIPFFFFILLSTPPDISVGPTVQLR